MNKLFSNSFDQSDNFHRTLGLLTFGSLTLGVAAVGTSSVSTIGYLLCLIFAVALSIVSRADPKFEKPRAVSIHFYVVMVLAALLLVNIAFGRSPYSSFELALRFMLAFYFVSGLAKFSKRFNYNFADGIVIIATIHVIVLTLVAMYQVGTASHYLRAHGNGSAMSFSEIMTTSYGIGIVWMFYKIRQNPNITSFVLFAGYLFLMIFSVSLTGTRGSLIAIYPLFIGLGMICFFCKYEKRTVLIGILSVALGYLMWTTLNDPRFATGVRELSQSLDGAENAGSVGMRISMWKHAWVAIKEQPIIGYGMNPFRDIVNMPADNELYRFTHAHNQFLDTWLKLGILGLIVFVMFLALPSFIGFQDTLKKSQPLGALLQIWIGGSFIVYGLTQAFLEHADSSIYFALFIVASLYIPRDGINRNTT